MQKQFLPEEEPPSSSPEESDPRFFRFFAADPRTPLLAVFLGLYSPSDGSKSLLCSASSSLELPPSDSLSVNSDGLTRSSNLGFFLGAGFFLGEAFLGGAFFLGGGGGDSSSEFSSSSSEASSSSEESFFFFFFAGVAFALGFGFGLAFGLG